MSVLGTRIVILAVRCLRDLEFLNMYKNWSYHALTHPRWTNNYMPLPICNAWIKWNLSQLNWIKSNFSRAKQRENKMDDIFKFKVRVDTFLRKNNEKSRVWKKNPIFTIGSQMGCLTYLSFQMFWIHVRKYGNKYRLQNKILPTKIICSF